MADHRGSVPHRLVSHVSTRCELPALAFLAVSTLCCRVTSRSYFACRPAPSASATRTGADWYFRHLILPDACGLSRNTLLDCGNANARQAFADERLLISRRHY